MKTNHVWIVEMKNGDRWEPTCGVGLDKNDGQIALTEFRRHNPDDMFRLKLYRSV